jgi:hypothetical protein
MAATTEQQLDQLFEYIQEFDADKNGFIDHAEMKIYLEAVGAWGTEPVYTDAGWQASWPKICRMLDADGSQGLPVASFKKFHTARARRGVQAPFAFSYGNQFLYGAFVWARGALNRRKRRFPARAEVPAWEA